MLLRWLAVLLLGCMLWAPLAPSLDGVVAHDVAVDVEADDAGDEDDALIVTAGPAAAPSHARVGHAAGVTVPPDDDAGSRLHRPPRA